MNRMDHLIVRDGFQHVSSALPSKSLSSLMSSTFNSKKDGLCNFIQKIVTRTRWRKAHPVQFDIGITESKIINTEKYMEKNKKQNIGKNWNRWIIPEKQIFNTYIVFAFHCSFCCWCSSFSFTQIQISDTFFSFFAIVWNHLTPYCKFVTYCVVFSIV